jgi:hypothetical protein
VKIVLLSLLTLTSPALASDEPGITGVPRDEPALPSPPPASSGGIWPRWERGPRLEASYRTFSIANQGDRRDWLHTFGADYYFISNILRAGGGIEGGFESARPNDFLFAANLSVGVQYPARFTPYLDLVLGLGYFHQGVMHQDLNCFAITLGIEAGIAVFVHQHLFLSAAVGWRHLGVRHPGDDFVDPATVYYDSFLARVGLGF